ncbi:hypothetical protein LAUMK35_01236 [Mycobacterium pseudokansasii]|nr:hypothetical protein LAUMK35_01236 [Mycobacterium pseudokansasii]VAZ91183.1 hypothetical protein LAUMK21_01236 [Mycobacterium pseudokansasii]
MAADTSSAPAASSPVVGAAASARAALIDDPIVAKSPATAPTISGAAITYDIGIPSAINIGLAVAARLVTGLGERLNLP